MDSTFLTEVLMRYDQGRPSLNLRLVRRDKTAGSGGGFEFRGLALQLTESFTGLTEELPYCNQQSWHLFVLIQKHYTKNKLPFADQILSML